MSENAKPNLKTRYRRFEVPEYLLERYGIPTTKGTLANLAVTGGGPAITYCGRIPLYHIDDLDKWAASRLSAPVSSTSERRSA